jgi:predicted DNA-binding protein (UPF0251 family)
MDARAELIKVIEDVRKRWRLKLALRGALIVLAGIVLTLVLASSGLQALSFTPNAIFGFRIAVFAAIIAIVGIWLFKPLRRSVTDDQVALYIEEQDPSLREELISAVEMSSAAKAGQPGVSQALLDRLVQDAITKVRALDSGRAVGREVVRRLALALGGGLVAATLLSCLVKISAQRRITLDHHARGGPAPFHINVEPGNTRAARLRSDIKASSRVRRTTCSCSTVRTTAKNSKRCRSPWRRAVMPSPAFCSTSPSPSATS